MEKTYEEMFAEELNAIFIPNTENIPVRDSAGACWNNRMVACLNRNECFKCGWNPQVAKNRVARLKRRLGIE